MLLMQPMLAQNELLVSVTHTAWRTGPSWCKSELGRVARPQSVPTRECQTECIILDWKSECDQFPGHSKQSMQVQPASPPESWYQDLMVHLI